MSRLTLIVAATKSNGIGQNARLPWRLPLEMKYFANVTSTAPEGKLNALVMGRNTWESIPRKFRPLPNRINMVISHNQDYDLWALIIYSPLYSCSKSVRTRGPISTTRTNVHNNLTSALMRISSDAEFIYRGYIIGGASLYNETLGLSPTSSPAFVDRILLTRIISPSFDECDVFMPDFLGDQSEGKGKDEWTRAPHDTLEAWVGFEVPKGVQEENGVEYEFQMWIRRS